MSAALVIDQLQLGYETAKGLHTVVQAFSLTLDAGDIGCLLGPSGCGKTTVLRAIAGFEPVRAGSIRLGDALLSSVDLHLPPERRRVGMMFQEYALFPHLDAAHNVGFGLRRWPRAARQQRVAEMLALVGLPDAGARLPHQLSGGQQQRIALARASASLCVTSTAVWPADLRMVRTSPVRRSRVAPSRFENGSSSSSSAGPGASARASAMRCCWPPDSSCG